MPKITDPKTSVSIGSGTRTGDVFNNLSSQVTINQSAYRADQISTRTPSNYLGDEVQSHFDDLEGLLTRPPFIGEGAVSYTFGSLSSTLTGVPDWGVLKQADSASWTRNSTITFDGNTAASTDFKLAPQDTFFYNTHDTLPLIDPRTDSVFNIIDPLLLGGGEGASYLSGRVGSDHAGDPNSQRDFPLVRATYSQASDGTAQEGFTISGFLFPADRGTLALLHWNGFMLSAATGVEDIRERVIAAINLNGGLEETDTSIFHQNQNEPSMFPSGQTGQYDLYELHTGKYRADLTGIGGDLISDPIASGDSTLGAVRLLRKENAANFGEGVDTTDTTRGHLPILFGAFEWDTGTTSWVETEANFLAYRLPMLESYEPSHLKTPIGYRERFFNKVQPADNTTPFTTAGGYVTLGEDQLSYQVARYRHVVKYSEMAGVSGSEIGSIALVHFKTESAFERLVRDGIAPSANDLWSVQIFNYDDATIEANTVYEGDGYTPIGTPTTPVPIDAISNPVVRPYVYVSDRDVDDKIDPTGHYNATFEQPNTDLTGGVWSRENGYYTTISGVKYLLPRFHTPYDGKYQNIEVPISFDGGVATPFATPFYTSTEGDLYERNYKTPLNPVTINLSPLTGSNTLSSEWSDGSTYSPISQSYIQRVEVPVGLMEDGITASSNLSSVNLLVSPLGDTGLCTFSEGLWTSALINDPLYHHDGLGFSKVLVSTPSENSSEVISTKVLYHSARLLSLIENCTTSTVNIFVNYALSARAKDCAFSIFRYDLEGFRVYQPLSLASNEVLEECSGEAKLGGVGVFPSYPTYRPIVPNNYSATISLTTATATFEAVDGHYYYLEVHPTSDGSWDAAYLQVVRLPSVFSDGDNGYADYQAIYDQRIVQSFLYEDPSNWYDSYGSLGYRLGRFRTSENGYSVPSNTGSFDHPYLPALVAADDYGKWITEVPKSDGTELPSYGNFTEDSLGIISVQGMSAPLGNLTVVIPAWADSSTGLERRALSSLFTARKDTQERFLDESYRIYPSFVGFDAAYIERPLVGLTTPTGWDANTLYQLIGGGLLWDGVSYSGLPFGVSPIDFFVRDDSDIYGATDTIYASHNHGASGYLRNGFHLNYIGDNDLPTSEVRALPPMPDAVLSGAKYGQPRRGLLALPGQTDYTANTYIPNSTYEGSWSTDDTATPKLYFEQPDNTEPSGDAVYYVRAFDVAFSRSGTTEDVEGISTFKFRVVGLSFTDFSGRDRGVEIQFKVPGKTAWLDSGVLYGAGDVSSPNQDGAGCLVSATDKLLLDEGVICCDLNLNMGQSLFLNEVGEATVLVRVKHHMIDAARALNFGATDPTNTPIRERRGLVGLEVLRNSTGLNYDGDEAETITEYTLTLIEVDLSDEVPVCSDEVTATLNNLFLEFALATNANTTLHNETFSIYTATGITDVSFPSVGHFPLPRITVTTTNNPLRRVIAPNPSLAQNTNFEGYLSNVIAPKTYTLYAETHSDDNVTPEMEIAFEVNDSNTETATGTLTYESVFSGTGGVARYYIYDLVHNADHTVDLNLQDSGTRYADEDSLTLVFTLDGVNTDPVYLNLYDETDDLSVTFTIPIANPHIVQLESDDYTAVFQAGQNFVGVDFPMLEATIKVGHSYKLSCVGNGSDSLRTKLYVTEPNLWIEGAYGSSTTVAGEGYTELKPSGTGHYDHYFFTRADGYLVFQYDTTPDTSSRYLGFSLSTNAGVTSSNEYFSLYRGTSISDLVFPELVVLDDSRLTVEDRVKPINVRAFPSDSISADDAFEGYYSNLEAGTYTIYAESISDTVADPEMNVAFEIQTSTPSSGSGLVYNNLLPGNAAFTWKYHVHELVIGAGDTANFVSGVSTGTAVSSYGVEFYLQGTNHTYSSDTALLKVSLYDLTTGSLVALSSGTDGKWTISSDVASADYSPTGSFLNTTDADSFVGSLTSGRHYKLVCYGSHLASLQVKIKTVVGFTDKWIEGAYGSATTIAGEGYIELMPQGGEGNTYEHYFFARPDGYLVFEYRPTPV